VKRDLVCRERDEKLAVLIEANDLLQKKRGVLVAGKRRQPFLCFQCLSILEQQKSLCFSCPPMFFSLFPIALKCVMGLFNVGPFGSYFRAQAQV